MAEPDAVIRQLRAENEQLRRELNGWQRAVQAVQAAAYAEGRRQRDRELGIARPRGRHLWPLPAAAAVLSSVWARRGAAVATSAVFAVSAASPTCGGGAWAGTGPDEDGKPPAVVAVHRPAAPVFAAWPVTPAGSPDPAETGRTRPRGGRGEGAAPSPMPPPKHGTPAHGDGRRQDAGRGRQRHHPGTSGHARADCGRGQTRTAGGLQ